MLWAVAKPNKASGGCALQLLGRFLPILEGAFARLEAAAKKVIAAVAEGDMLRTQMAIVRRLAKHEPVNVIALQEKIAARVLETGKYVTA